eukprot:GHVL01031700.1.p1 GENE.GHVL01031700.1~~GHVL01031700.1.p1  ORF type:complete len:426 (+),score=90.42 GHVL01031700.1:95-1372(+)
MWSKITDIIPIYNNIYLLDYPALNDQLLQKNIDNLNNRFGNNYLLYNLSEREYSDSNFHGEVVKISFRGLPCPPLDMLVQMCVSINSWLDASPSNVLLIHCFRGHSRATVLIACYLTWCGYYEFPREALRDVCKIIGIDDAKEILPSQKRYLDYFLKIKEGYSPPSDPCILTKVLINTSPDYQICEKDQQIRPRFKPILEVWAAGAILFSSESTCEEVPEYFYEEESAVFDCNLPCSGDLLIRVRHIHPGGDRESAFRLAFHTDYCSDGVLHAETSELDTSIRDGRFPQDFFVETFFQFDEPRNIVEESNDLYHFARERFEAVQKRIRANQIQEVINKEEMAPRLIKNPINAQAIDSDADSDQNIKQDAEIVKSDEITQIGITKPEELLSVETRIVEPCTQDPPKLLDLSSRIESEVEEEEHVEW